MNSEHPGGELLNVRSNDFLVKMAGIVLLLAAAQSALFAQPPGCPPAAALLDHLTRSTPTRWN